MPVTVICCFYYDTVPVVRNYVLSVEHDLTQTLIRITVLYTCITVVFVE